MSEAVDDEIGGEVVNKWGVVAMSEKWVRQACGVRKSTSGHVA